MGAAAFLPPALWLAVAPPPSAARAEEEPQAEEAEFHPEDYPARTLEEVLAADPCRKDAYEVKDVLFQAEWVYRGDLRDVSAVRLELLRRWTERIRSEVGAAAFKKELKVEAGKRALWVSVPESLLPHLGRELEAGGQTVFYLSYVGCAGGEPVVAVEEFGQPGYEDLEEEQESYVAWSRRGAGAVERGPLETG